MGTTTLDDVRAAGNELKEKYQAILKTKKRTYNYTTKHTLDINIKNIYYSIRVEILMSF